MLVDKDNLAAYISENDAFPLVKDSLIACALGGQATFLEDEQYPLSILFYPEGEVRNFRYFESSSANIDPNDYANYQLQSLPEQPIFNGYLHSFQREEIQENLWGLVTYEKNGKLYISNPIHLKFPETKTEFNPALLTLDQSELLEPNFKWEDGVQKDNVIYFHVILDEKGDLLSGTYTFDRNFQFYDLSNVVLNIRDTNPPPALEPNSKYTFILMGVSVDNWVNLVIAKMFET
ncbi:MAG: hypothetical protein AAFO82_13405 [Bacteroidota bacterium]